MVARIVTILVLQICCVAGAPAAELIPAERTVDWTPRIACGVPGGIPTNRHRLIDVTKAPFSADNLGLPNVGNGAFKGHAPLGRIRSTR